MCVCVYIINVLFMKVVVVVFVITIDADGAWCVLY